MILRVGVGPLEQRSVLRPSPNMPATQQAVKEAHQAGRLGSAMGAEPVPPHFPQERAGQRKPRSRAYEGVSPAARAEGCLPVVDPL